MSIVIAEPLINPAAMLAPRRRIAHRRRGAQRALAARTRPISQSGEALGACVHARVFAAKILFGGGLGDSPAVASTLSPRFFIESPSCLQTPATPRALYVSVVWTPDDLPDRPKPSSGAKLLHE